MKMDDKCRITKWLPNSDLNWLKSEVSRLWEKEWKTLIATRCLGSQKADYYAIYREEEE
jgi:hypothetical protein|tara:strand:- start:161 stop:337 length:177 start_codon:yes stop_codon:yes gene_type:complete